MIKQPPFEKYKDVKIVFTLENKEISVFLEGTRKKTEIELRREKEGYAHELKDYVQRNIKELAHLSKEEIEKKTNEIKTWLRTAIQKLSDYIGEEDVDKFLNKCCEISLKKLKEDIKD